MSNNMKSISGLQGVSISFTDYPDYLLIKDLPGHKSGCIFSIGKNYIYYISYDPDDWKEDSVKSKDFVPEKDSLIRFNKYTMSNNPEWFKPISVKEMRELKIDRILK